MRPKRLEILILLFTFVLIAAVAAIGSITFSNLRSIEKESEKIYEPNKTLISLKQLLSELRNAENCLRSFSLYNNTEYFDEYERSLEKMEECFDSLDTWHRYNPEMKLLLDSTYSLVDEKLGILEKQTSLRNEQKVVDEVNRINVKLDKVTRRDTMIIAQRPATLEASDEKKVEEAPLVQAERKRGFFARLFHRHKSEKQAETTNGDLPAGKREPALDSVRIILNRGSIDEVKSEVRKVKKSQTNLFSQMKEEELKLMEEDRQIWSKLLNIIALLENKQNDALKAIAGDNISKTNKMHRYTKAFGLLILVMLCFVGLFSVYYFYSERRHAGKLKAETDKSRMLAKAREIFLANMSHEMRTPLNAITGFTEQMRSSSLNGEQKKQLDIIHSASRHLLNLINDVLDISKIEADKIQFEKIAFNPLKEVREVYELLSPKAGLKNLRTRLETDNDLPASLIGDPLRLRQILINLFSNAIKFTNEGEIVISVSVQKKIGVEQNNVNLHVSVKDSGIGISEEMIGKVFDNFTQADTSITRKYGGTGLGLSITKKIVEMQGGDISIESETGKGTAISFSIPYEVNYSEVNAEPESQEQFIPATVAGKKVLIADDEPFNRILLITILKRWGVLYEEVANGKEVLEKIKEKNYDLILMDVRMPEVSGIDASRTIRQMSDPGKSSVPIIALTAITSGEKRELCLEAGMDEVITKPYNEQELIRLMEKIFLNTHRNSGNNEKSA